VTFSTFINVLDGTSSVNGLPTILTTNHPQLLDPTMLRSSRVDRIWEIYSIVLECVSAMIHHWAENCKEDNEETSLALAKDCLKKLKEKNLSLASLQSFLFNCVVNDKKTIEEFHANISLLDREVSGSNNNYANMIS
jgi:SpoVK/Ycf46/Vps4 family AAA+-type ATPase